MNANQLLASEQVDDYRKDGYLIVPDLLTAEEVDEFLSHTAAPDVGLHGHIKDPQFRRLAIHPEIAGRAEQLLGGRARIVQTMFLNKSAQGGQGVALHQDSHYLPSEPNTLMACWVALTDTDESNGGLCVVPGSQLGGLRRAHRTQNQKDHVSWEYDYPMRDRDGREWVEKMFSFEIDDLDPSQVVRLTVPRGAGVFFSGMIIHGSFANDSSRRPRPAFAVHYVREDTWLFRQDVQKAALVAEL